MSAVAQRTSADGSSTLARAFPEREAGEWYVLHTLSRQEKALAEELSNLGIAYFLPLVRQVRYYGRRKVEVELPLFGCYLFLRGSREDAFRADRTRRVANILTVCDQDRLDWELRNLHLALSRNAVLDPYPYLVHGARVQVRAGPFRGLEGIVDVRVKPNRLILQVEMLGRAVSLEVDAALLDVVEASAA
ncbi:MAG TPA: transcription termination/antitermination NusG family protein [Tepidisphaeraceae bacterium]|nr:transcription termination/antitermination NusG family protein [Tepidisphaeraceae bacterium]